MSGACAGINTIDFQSIAPIALLNYRIDYGQRIVVQGTINQAGPYDFIVDTAATQTIVFENAADPLSMTPSNTPEVMLVGLSGLSKTSTYNIGDIDIGGIRLKNHTAPILPNWADTIRTPNGILGLDYFQNKIVVIDPASKTLKLYLNNKQNANTLPDNWAPVKMSRSNFGFSIPSFYIVDVTLSGRNIPFLLDTGSEATVCNFPATHHIKTDPPIDFTKSGKTDLTDAHGTVISSFIIHNIRLKVGETRLRERPLLAADARFFEQIGYKEKPFGLLGLDNLLQQPLAIDFTRHLLYMEAT